MRSYDVAIASLAIDAPTKWTDNLISHYRLSGIVSERRGISRRISHGGLVRLALVRQLHTGLGLGAGDAVRVAQELLESGGTGVYASGQLRLTIDLPALERALDARLAEVLESAPTPRRGRPPRAATSGS